MPHIARERYSELVDAKLRATIVKRVGVICNNRYEGSPKAGAVKVPVRDTEVTVADYNKKTGTAMTHGDTSFLTVNIDKDKAVNELIDGFDAESVPGHLVADRLDSAGYSLALQMETDASAELVTGGTAMDSTAALTKANIYDTIVDARTKLSETHVPTDGRWLLVSPETYALLLKSPETPWCRPARWAAWQALPSLRIPPSARRWTLSRATPTGSPASRSGASRWP